MKRILVFLMSVMLLASLGTNVFANGQKDAGAKKIKVGLSFSDFATARWPREEKALRKQFEAMGAEVFTQVANHDAKLQNDQIDNLVLQGVNVLIIIAEDGASAATAVDSAKKDGVAVIAYDRLIKSPNLDAYISFDNVEVGRVQARGVLKVVDKGNFLLLGGSPTDNNAVLFRKGQMEILQPLIDKGQIKVVGDQWVDNWDPAVATTKMENMLTAVSNKVDAVVASNDGTALGAIQALKAQGLAGKVPISGQDATLAGCQSIVAGELTLTVFKDLRQLVPMAVNTAMTLAKGEKLSGLTMYTLKDLTGDDISGNVPCKFLKVVGVNKNNLYDVIVKSGFQPYDEVYRDVPANKRPPKP